MTSSITFPQPAATTLSGGRLREPVERGGPSHALRAPAFLQQGTRWICNFRGGFKALRSLLPLSRIRLQDLPKSFGVAAVLLCENHLSLLAAAHVVNSNSGAEACPTKEFPKLERMFPRIA